MTTQDPAATPQKPKTIDDFVREHEMTPEEEAQLEAQVFTSAREGIQGKGDEEQEQPDPNALPDWVQIPGGFKIPKGKRIAFMRFRAAWTDSAELGDRWCMLWNLSDADHKLALVRTMGNSARNLSELSKQIIRLIGTVGEVGKKADWTKSGDPAFTHDVDKFWNEIGEKCRQQIQNYYVQAHLLSPEEKQDFLLNCFFVRSAVAG